MKEWLGMAWAAIKGACSFGTTAKLEIVDYLLELAYSTYANVDRIMENIAKTHRGLVWVCDKLDYYSSYVPAPWGNIYLKIREALGALRDLLEDGRAERAEIEKLAAAVKDLIASWNK